MSTTSEDATVILSTSLVGRPLGEILIAQGKLTEQGLAEALVHQKERGGRLGELLVDQAMVQQADVAEALAAQMGMPFEATIDGEAIDPALVAPFSLAYVRQYNFVPLRKTGRRLVVAVSDPLEVFGLDDLRAVFQCEIVSIVAPEEQIFAAINVVFDRRAGAEQVVDEVAGDDADEIATELEEATRDILDASDDEAPIIRLVNSVLNQAIKEMVSDIHIEPFEKELNVRYRVDGVLHNTVRPPYRLKESIVARIKIMAGLNIAEKRLPQDGRIRRRMGGREIDLRVSTVPVRHGERVVMRVLEKGEIFNLDALGMGSHILDIWRELIHKPYGILLVTGPTGSGKSSTLFASLAEINSPDKNILTIEDPIEYELAGLGQVQVNHKINLTFASALRAFLRQDPDVILVGEIRDTETAANAVQASLTGHLVFSTLHTNDAAGAFARLLDMNVEPFLVATSLLGVVAQRLVRRLCGECKEEYTPTDAEVVDMGISRSEITGSVYRSKGCSQCNQSGYRGRCGIFEFLPATDEIKSAIIGNADAASLKKLAVQSGMRTLRDDGVTRVLAGITSFDEVMRVTREDSQEETE